MKKLIFVCSALRGDVKANQEKARYYCKEVVDAGHIPICPHIYFTQFLDDEITEDRVKGMSLGLQLLLLCSEVWVYGEQTEGMMKEINFAYFYEIPVTKKEGI